MQRQGKGEWVYIHAYVHIYICTHNRCRCFTAQTPPPLLGRTVRFEPWCMYVFYMGQLYVCSSSSSSSSCILYTYIQTTGSRRRLVRTRQPRLSTIGRTAGLVWSGFFFRIRSSQAWKMGSGKLMYWYTCLDFHNQIVCGDQKKNKGSWTMDAYHSSIIRLVLPVGGRLLEMGAWMGTCRSPCK